jgi:hypothetical protein
LVLGEQPKQLGGVADQHIDAGMLGTHVAG